MNSNPMPSTVTPVTNITSQNISFARAVSWGAIIAGCVAALGMHLLLTILAMGVGMQTIEPLSTNRPMTEFSLSAGISWSISALISLWVGGWVAGRFADVANRHLGRLHGFLVWSLATVVTFFTAALGAGALLGGAATFATKGLSAATQAAAPAARDVFQEFTQQNGGLISGFIDEAAPVRDAQQNSDPAATARARREIGWGLFSFFAQEGDIRSPEKRAALVQTVSQYSGRSQADAERMVNDWVASYDRAQQQLAQTAAAAEQNIRETAERTKDATTRTAVWIFVAFMIGAAASIWGGHAGAKLWWNADYPEASRSPFPQT